MNVSEYISSGILELYANGLTSPEENQEVEAALAKYPEVRNELNEIQEALATMASVNFQAPGPGLLEKIMDRIEEEEKTAIPTNTQKEVKVMDISGEKPSFGSKKADLGVKPSPFFRYLAIAASILLLASVALNLFYFNKLNLAEEQIASLQNSQSVIAGEMDVLKASYESIDRELLVLRNPDFKEIRMDDKTAASLIGTINQPNALATAHWNPKTSELFVYANNLQAPPEGYQYQLWAVAFVGGNPVPTDAGVFDVNGKLQSQKKISGKVDAFAVTLEKKGGSPSPTLGKMFVAGTT
jgi:anti-sigma-K factor RskA